MVEVVAVARALDAAHARQCSVERVAKPVHYQQGGRDPQPPVVGVRSQVGDADADRGSDSQRGQIIRQDPARQTARNRAEDSPLVAGEQEVGLAGGVDGGHQSSSRTLVDRWSTVILTAWS